MIVELRLENFLFMKEALLEFSPGLNVITGETGAGKSILLEAVKLVLGKKGKSGLVMPGETTAKIQAVFEISPQLGAWDFLDKSGYLNEEDPNSLTISRTFKMEGSEKVFVNGIMTSAAFLKDLGKFLMEIHGQNDHQTLLFAETQRRLLDRTGGELHLKHLSELKILYEDRKKLSSEFEELRKRICAGAEKIRELQEIIRELQDLALESPDEETNLKEEAKRLVYFEQIIGSLQTAIQALSGEDDNPGAVSLVYRAKDALKHAVNNDLKLNSPFDKLDSIFIELQDIQNQLCKMASECQYDPDRNSIIQARLAEISRCSRKFRTDAVGLIDLKKTVQREVDELTAPDATMKNLQTKLDEVESKYFYSIKQVSTERKKLSVKLAKSVSDEMSRLGFPSEGFSLDLKNCEPGQYGAEFIEFVVSVNPGGQGGPLKKIASGGELSRVALAIKKVLAQSDELPTLLFDEIDSGIGGTTAQAVAKSLKSLSEKKQVILVTHLHQIAKEGQKHFTVDKTVNDGTTKIQIHEVQGKGREAEIARMLGTSDSAGLAYARSILKEKS